MNRSFASFITVPLAMLVGGALVLVLTRHFAPAQQMPNQEAWQTVPDLAPATPLEPKQVEARGDLASIEKTTVDIFSKTSPSVVFITNLQVQHDVLRRNAMTIPRGTGSGFLWDEAGHVVTNFHVIAGADAAKVTLSDQSVWNAKLVGAYPAKDLAVLQIDAPKEKLKPLQAGTSSDLVVGQYVFAIGNPFGLDHTLSTGVISGLGREIMSMDQRPISGAIQTDAAINPGNSGGPLLDSAGRLIGVNTAIYSPSGASVGVGFAVPVDTVVDVVSQLIRHGKVARPALGIQIDDRLSQRFGMAGLMIVGVEPGSGAAEAGLRATYRDRQNGNLVLGDILVGIDGTKVGTSLDLFRALDSKKVGEKVRVSVQRGSDRYDVDVPLGQIIE